MYDVIESVVLSLTIIRLWLVKMIDEVIPHVTT